MNLENFKKDIDLWLNSSEGKVYFENELKKTEIRIMRYNKFNEWLKTNNFDNLLYRLIVKHDDDYIKKCHENGFEAYPNNVLQFIFDYAFVYGKKINKSILKKKKLDCDFPYDIKEFEGYYFQIIYGQGTINRIYNKADLRLLLQV